MCMQLEADRASIERADQWGEEEAEDEEGETPVAAKEAGEGAALDPTVRTARPPIS